MGFGIVVAGRNLFLEFLLQLAEHFRKIDAFGGMHGLRFGSEGAHHAWTVGEGRSGRGGGASGGRCDRGHGGRSGRNFNFNTGCGWMRHGLVFGLVFRPSRRRPGWRRLGLGWLFVSSGWLSLRERIAE